MTVNDTMNTLAEACRTVMGTGSQRADVELQIVYCDFEAATRNHYDICRDMAQALRLAKSETSVGEVHKIINDALKVYTKAARSW